MVGLASLSPNAPALLRKASRLADRLNAPWYAVYIRTPAEDTTKTDAASQRFLYKKPGACQTTRGHSLGIQRQRCCQHGPGLRAGIRHQGHCRG